LPVVKRNDQQDANDLLEERSLEQEKEGNWWWRNKCMKAAHPLRTLTPTEVRPLQRAAKATSERADAVKRAQALLAVTQARAILRPHRLPDTKVATGSTLRSESFRQRLRDSLGLNIWAWAGRLDEEVRSSVIIVR
jgi:hypothetical protein